MTDRRAPTRTCPECHSPDYAFRARRTVEPADGGPPEVETKYRCKACGHEWKVRVLAGRAA